MLGNRPLTPFLLSDASLSLLRSSRRLQLLLCGFQERVTQAEELLYTLSRVRAEQENLQRLLELLPSGAVERENLAYQRRYQKSSKVPHVRSPG